MPKDPLNNITFQKIPDEVTKFQVTFMPPSELNGNIQIYQAIVYKEDDPTVFQIHNLSVIDRTNKSITAIIHGLKGGHTYNISVSCLFIECWKVSGNSVYCLKASDAGKRCSSQGTAFQPSLPLSLLLLGWPDSGAED